MKNKYHSISVPDDNWRFQLGKRGQYIAFNTQEAPNWFHRTMQRLILGIYWKRLDREEK